MSEAFVGEIRYFGGNFAPANWAHCAGQLMPISGYETLYTLLGTTYGGDGMNSFALPDLRGRIPVHHGTGSDGIGYAIGQQGGAEFVSLTPPQLPAHTHSVHAAAAAATTASAQNMVPASWADTPYAPATAGTPQPLHASSSGTAGEGHPHENRPPHLAIGYVICLYGIFPSRP